MTCQQNRRSDSQRVAHLYDPVLDDGGGSGIDGQLHGYEAGAFDPTGGNRWCQEEGPIDQFSLGELESPQTNYGSQPTFHGLSEFTNYTSSHQSYPAFPSVSLVENEPNHVDELLRYNWFPVPPRSANAVSPAMYTHCRFSTHERVANNPKHVSKFGLSSDVAFTPMRHHSNSPGVYLPCHFGDTPMMTYADQIFPQDPFMSFTSPRCHALSSTALTLLSPTIRQGDDKAYENRDIDLALHPTNMVSTASQSYHVRQPEALMWDLAPVVQVHESLDHGSLDSSVDLTIKDDTMENYLTPTESPDPNPFSRSTLDFSTPSPAPPSVISSSTSTLGILPTQKSSTRRHIKQCRARVLKPSEIDEVPVVLRPWFHNQTRYDPIPTQIYQEMSKKIRGKTVCAVRDCNFEMTLIKGRRRAVNEQHINSHLKHRQYYCPKCQRGYIRQEDHKLHPLILAASLKENPYISLPKHPPASDRVPEINTLHTSSA